MRKVMQDRKTVNLSTSIHRQLKRLAAERGTTMQALLEQAIETVYHLNDPQSQTEPSTKTRKKGTSHPVRLDLAPPPSTTTRILYTDAGTKDNGGPRQQSRICVHTGTLVLVDQPIGNYTNNEAEILAIEHAIRLAGSTPTTIRSDSQLAVNLITRRWKGKKPHLKQLISTVRLPRHIKLEWVPREQNPAGWHLEDTYKI